MNIVIVLKGTADLSKVVESELKEIIRAGIAEGVPPQIDYSYLCESDLYTVITASIGRDPENPSGELHMLVMLERRLD